MNFGAPIAGLMIARKPESLPRASAAASPVATAKVRRQWLGFDALLRALRPRALPVKAVLAARLFAQLCTAFHREAFRFFLPTKNTGSIVRHRLSREASKT